MRQFNYTTSNAYGVTMAQQEIVNANGDVIGITYNQDHAEALTSVLNLAMHPDMENREARLAMAIELLNA